MTSLPEDSGKINDEVKKDYYSDPNGKYKIHQEGYKLYLSELDKDGNEVISSRHQLADMATPKDLKLFKNKFSEIAEYPAYAERIESTFTDVKKLEYGNRSIFSDLTNIAIDYTKEHGEAYLALPENAELKAKLESKGIPFQQYLEEGRKESTLGADDFLPMVIFFLREEGTIQQQAFALGIDQDYLWDAIDNKIPADNQNEKVNWARLNNALRVIGEDRA